MYSCNFKFLFSDLTFVERRIKNEIIRNKVFFVFSVFNLYPFVFFRELFVHLCILPGYEGYQVAKYEAACFYKNFHIRPVILRWDN